MVKSLDAPYEAGRRGAGWLKVKPAHTLDLVVLAAEWGHGRRHGQALEPPSRRARPGERRLRDAREDVQGHDRRDARLADGAPARARDGPRGPRRPRAAGARRRGRVRRRADELALSGRVALRFARVKGYRPDKSPSEADTIDTVRAIHARAE